MAIPGLVYNIVLQTGNGSNFLSWPIVAGATTYTVQRSLDGVTFSTVGSPATNYYLDSSVTTGTNYYYQVASTNTDGTSGYNPSYPVSIVPCLPGQINLGYLRYMSQLRADKLNSEFLTTDEWNWNINQSIYELYDILVTKFGDDYFMAAPVTFTTTGARNYPLPDGTTTIGGSVPQGLYKLIGVDCGVAVGNNAWVTLPRYNWIDRNKFIYPQLQANALGVFNLSYRQMGNQLYFIPNPSAGQYIQIWYVPVLNQLLKDTDMLDFSISGWSELIIVDAAIKALLKEEGFEQADALSNIKMALLERIQTTAANRDVGQPNTISDTRGNTGFYDGGGFGGSGHGMGGWLLAPLGLFPSLFVDHIGNGLLSYSKFKSQLSLTNTLFIFITYLFYLIGSKFCRRIRLARISNNSWIRRSISSFLEHIHSVFFWRSKKEMSRVNTPGNITFMTHEETIRDLSVMYLPRKPVRLDALPSWTWDPKGSISIFVDTTGPKPTFFSFLNSIPKPFLHRRPISNGGE